MLNSINHAASLPAMHNQDLQVLMGTRLSEYVIRQYRRTLATELFLSVDSDVDLCSTITYLVEDHGQLPSMSDSALDASFKRQTISPPRVINFHGFCKGGFEIKLAQEQMECVDQFPILKTWYNDQLATAIENGRNALLTRFYRTLLTSVHPKNTGNNAGMQSGGQVLGTAAQPVLYDVDNADLYYMSILNTIKQMPKSTSVANEFGQSVEDGFVFGPQEMESVLMKVAAYNNYDSVGSCANCSLFRDVFMHKPRGLMPITNFCVESRQCTTAGGTQTVYPVLFGKRYRGAKAAIRVSSKQYTEDATDSIIFKVLFYWHMHVYDCRNLGLSWITIKDLQPQLAEACA